MWCLHQAGCRSLTPARCCRADEWNKHHQSVDPSASDSGRDDSHPMTGRSSAHSVQSSRDSPRSSGEALDRSPWSWKVANAL